MDTGSDNAMEYYFFQTLPRSIIRDVIFRDMLSLEDIARLEVAAAVHAIHEAQVRALTTRQSGLLIVRYWIIDMMI
jgi:hypothetical protein